MIRIAIIAANESEEIELVVPLDLWRRSGFRVDVISLEKKNTIVLQNGLKISCDTTIDRANLNQYNAIYMPGGQGHTRYRIENWPSKNNDNVTKLYKFINKFNEDENKYLVSMCASPLVLNELEAIGDRKYTCYPGYNKLNTKKYVNQSVVIEDGLITARAPGSAFDLAYAVIETFASKEKVNELKNMILDYKEDMKK